MPAEPLNVAVIGLGSFGGQMATALAELDEVELVGLADNDPQRGEELAGLLDTSAWTDHRQMLMTTRPAAVFLATPPMPAAELLDECASLRIAVWKDAPLARNLGEAAAWTRRFDRAGLALAVGTQRRFAETYSRARSNLPKLGRVLLARAEYHFDWSGPLRWRADRQSAGGGALLELGFHFADLLVWMLGLPEDVLGLTRRRARAESDPPAAPHDTDDAAQLSLRYPDDALACLQVSRIAGPVRENLHLVGCGGSLDASAHNCTLREAGGNVLDRLNDCSGPAELFRRQARAFLRAVRDEAPRYPASAGESLLTHAVLDAGYLSSRTLTPESPLRQLQLHQLRPEDCLTHSLDTRG